MPPKGYLSADAEDRGRETVEASFIDSRDRAGSADSALTVIANAPIMRSSLSSRDLRSGISATKLEDETTLSRQRGPLLRYRANNARGRNGRDNRERVLNLACTGGEFRHPERSGRSAI